MIILNTYPQLIPVRDLAIKKKRSVFLVGGFLRDFYLGNIGRSFDMDFALDKNALTFAQAFARIIKGTYVLLDKEHGSARVVRRDKGRIWTYDFTDFRGSSIEDDLSLRDFTVNTFCLDLISGNNYAHPKAARDFKIKNIRMTSPCVFQDDPLRLLRAYSLFAQTGFIIERYTSTRIRKDAHLINNCAMERTREEFFKILQSPRSFVTIIQMFNNTLLERIVPHFAVMYGIKQGGYHHLNVWRHSLEVLRQLEILFEEFNCDGRIRLYLLEEIGGAHSRGALLKLAALLHDIGKPETRKKEGDRMTFHGHEHVGERITRQVAKRLKLSVKERYFLEDAVRMHLRPGYLSNFKKPSARVVFRYMRDAKEEAVSLAILAMADQRATQGPLTTKEKNEHHDKICRMVIEEYFKEKTKPVRVRLLTGHDLINTFKLKPSPQFTKILTTVDEAHALGKIKNKAEALSLVKTLL